MQKTAVSSPKSDGFSVKKRRFLKLIRIFVGIKKVYHPDCQPLLSNAKNKRFLSSNDHALTNIVCICSQNSLFVDFFHWHQ